MLRWKRVALRPDLQDIHTTESRTVEEWPIGVHITIDPGVNYSFDDLQCNTSADREIVPHGIIKVVAKQQGIPVNVRFWEHGERD